MVMELGEHEVQKLFFLLKNKTKKKFLKQSESSRNMHPPDSPDICALFCLLYLFYNNTPLIMNDFHPCCLIHSKKKNENTLYSSKHFS